MKDGCVAMLPSGRWATIDCSTPLPYACVPASDVSTVKLGTTWGVNLNRTGPWLGDKSPCDDGFVPSAPHNGYTNNLLLNFAYGQTIWLNVTPEL